MFNQLADKFDTIIKGIKGESHLTEVNIAESMREIRRALLEADVNYKVAKEFSEKVKSDAIGQKVYKSVKPGQQLTKIVHDHLVELLGGTRSELNYSTQSPTVFLVCGLQGTGKTTFSAKLANYLKQRKKYPLLVAADHYRPAAVDQLKILGQSIEVPVFFEQGLSPVELAKKSIDVARKNGQNIVIIDTAGRLHVDQEMMEEVSSIRSMTHPDEVIFVLDSMTGQDAVNAAEAFNNVVGFSGVAVTKLDGDTRGGAVLSIKHVLGKPIKFVSSGEKIDNLEPFYPDRMANRILGMGDVVSLVEKARDNIDGESVKDLGQKLKNNQFDFSDFYTQLQQMKKMGSMSSILGMMPGIGNALKGVEIDDQMTVKTEAIIQSMTMKERKFPEILNGSRRLRIAHGSGTSVQDVNRLIKQFTSMKKMMKSVGKLKGRPLNPAMLKSMFN